MAREEQYLVRGPDGRMVTINARSLRGAMNEYLRNYKPPVGRQFSVKLRGGGGDWTHYDVLK
jgi:hypothetical protein